MSHAAYAHRKVLLITITSGSVTVSRAHIPKAPHTAVFAHVAPEISILDARTKSFGVSSADTASSASLSAAATTLDALLTESPKDPFIPDHIVLTLGTPWILSQMRQLVYKKPVPFVFTEALSNELVQKEIDYITAHDMAQFSGLGASLGAGSDVQVIEKNLSTILLNGYETTKPFGKRASELSMMLAVSVSPHEVVNRFTDTIRRHYGTRPLTYTSSVTSVWSVIRDMGTTMPDFWIADISETTTDIIFIKDGSLLYHHTVPFGAAIFTKNTPKDTSDQTETLPTPTIAAAQTNALHETAARAVATGLAQAGADWAHAVEGVFDSHAYGLCAPAHAYVVADAQTIGFFEQEIRSNEFIKHICGATDVDVHPLTSTELVSAHPDTPLRAAIASIFATRIVY